MNTTQNLLQTKYNQIYDTIHRLKYSDYISDKQNIVHIDLFNNAISGLIDDINHRNIYGHREPIFAPAKDIVNKLSNCYYISDPTKPLIDDSEESDFDINNYHSVEHKKAKWFEASSIVFFYINGIVKNDKGKNMRLKLGPYSLEPYWNAEYTLERKNIEYKELGENIPNYEINNINFVTGNVELYDKMNNNNINTDIDYISNNDLKYNNTINSNQIFTKLRKE